MTRLRTGLLLLLLRLGLAGLLPSYSAAAADRPSLEYQVKAAFLLNFTKFVDWPAPESPNAPFLICLTGDDPFGPALDRIVQGETVNGRKIVVQRRDIDSAKGCQILFVGKTDKGMKDFRGTLGPDVLTVGEGEPFLRAGGVIAFVLENRRVRFDISLNAARSQRLNLSSKLLAVARTVDN